MKTWFVLLVLAIAIAGDQVVANGHHQVETRTIVERVKVIQSTPVTLYAAPNQHPPHSLRADAQTVFYLGQWATTHTKAYSSLDTYASLAQEGVTTFHPVWEYIALVYIRELRSAIHRHNNYEIRTDGEMIMSWARLLGAG